jgi:hypothetical protein
VEITWPKGGLDLVHVLGWLVWTVTGLIACPPFIFRSFHAVRDVPVSIDEKEDGCVGKIRRKMGEAWLWASETRWAATKDPSSPRSTDSTPTHLYERVKCVCQMMHCFDRVQSKYKRYLWEKFRMAMHIGTAAS